MDGISFVQLPVVLDVASLQSDLLQIKPEEWIDHFRGEHYEGKWSIVPLRSVAGHPAVIYSTPAGGGADFYKNTPILDRCKYYQEVLSWFQCRINAARLMSLSAGARILEHTDDMDGSGDGEWRIHIPIQTHEKVLFWLNKQLVPMREGQVWYADFNLPHSVDNQSPISRIHLVLDCTPNDWLKDQLKKGLQMQESIAVK